MADYSIAVVQDAIRILDILKCSGSGLTLAAITAESGLVKNKVFRILFTLGESHLVERDEAGRYRLGMRLLELGQHVQNNTSLLEVSAPVMDHLVRETHESIFLGVVRGDDALCVAARESPRSVRLFAEVGRRIPLHKGGIPKILFAHLPHDEYQAHLERVYGAGSTVPVVYTQEKFQQIIEQIRRQGYVVASDDLDPGAHSIAAPIRNHQGAVIAAISIAGPSHRFTPECIERYLTLVVEAARKISEALGYVAASALITNGVRKLN